MPSVPRYDTPQVRPAAVPNVRVGQNLPVEAFGGGTNAEAIGRAGQNIVNIGDKFSDAAFSYGMGQEKIVNARERIALEEQEKADRTRVDELEAKSRREKNRLMYSTDEKDPGVYLQKGQNAIGVVNTYGDRFKKYNDGLEKEALNENQQRLWRTSRTRQELDFEDSLNRHTASETQGIADNAKKAGIVAAREDGVLNYHKPGAVKISIAEQERMVRERAQINGVTDSNVIRMEIADANSRTHEGVVRRMLSQGNDLDAGAYYKQNKDQINSKTQEELNHALEQGSVRGESQRQADRILSEYTEIGAAREAARQIKDPKVRDAVDERIKNEFAFKEHQQTVARSQNFMDAYNILEGARKAKGVAQVEDIPNNIWGQMTPEQRNSSRALVDRLNARTEPTTDPQIYLKYYGMPEQELARVRESELIEKVYPHVSNGDWGKLTSRWASVRDATNKPAKQNEVKSMYTDEEMVLGGLRSVGAAGISQADTVAEIYKSESKAAVYNKFREKVDQAWQAWAHDNGGKMPNAEQKKKIVDQMAYNQVFVNKNWIYSDPQVPAAIVTDEDKGLAYVPMSKIEPAHQDEMRNYIRSVGKKITQSKLERMRAARLMNDRELYKKIAEE